ncbi:MAG TPA: nuclear transport factor 2 family protein [Candidatus Acidoferrum sp.]|nr:nuclear transport factor 2 family protein [Candidatus Acidoferrum sp.]
MHRKFTILLAVIASCVSISTAVLFARPPQPPDDLLQVRETVWRSWFAGDIPTLERLVPPDTIVVSPGQANFETQADIIAESKRFHDGGGKLIRLEFPLTKVQRFGGVAIIYSHYLYETESGGKRVIHTGASTETFVLRDGHWVNPGWQTASDK